MQRVINLKNFLTGCGSISKFQFLSINRSLTMAKQVHDDGKFTGVRLPTNIKPSHYDLCLTPDFDKFTFEGSLKVDYQSSEPAESIVLNAHELVIHGGSIQENDSNPLSVVTYSESTETVTLEFRDKIAPKGTLMLNFTGTLNDKMKGFYRTTFKIGGQVVHAATTQFEATDARRCFPCWDEPAVKATFIVTLKIKKFIEAGGKKYERMALSNMPEESRSDDDVNLEVKFVKSPIMSTYLLAFIIGPFEMIEGSDKGRRIRVFTTPGKKEQGRFALEVACKALPFYEDYFQIKYPLPKMDLVAIPDFASGAMENWGLVTYRETCLLVDPKNTSTNTRQWIAIVVAHELAHQWFGNLVTMEWWTHLWLNEGFASFMEFLCVDHIFPEYDIWTQFISETYIPALDLDSLDNSHPIEVPVKHPAEIDEIFDTISYLKGASVIRMLYNYIGDDSFRRGMQDYLTKFAYKNAQTEDLWDCLEVASGKPVRRLMSGWTSQKGYPWLSIECATGGKLSLKQEKFTADGKISNDDASTTWMIPISVATGDEPKNGKDVCLMDGKSATISIDGSDDNWVKFNPGTVGLYRCAYPETMIKKFLPAISDLSLQPLDRLGLQNDLFALCQAGKVNSVDLFKMLEAYKNETNYTVWASIDGCLGQFATLLAGTEHLDKLHAFGCWLYSDSFDRLTWSIKENEKHVDALMRTLVINRLVSFGNKDVINQALDRYKAHVTKSSIIPADLRAAVYKTVAIYGDEEQFESLFTIYRTDELHEEKLRAARALGFTRNEDRLKRTINFILSDELRNQDKVSVIAPIGRSNPALAWKFFQNNKDMLKGIYESGFLMSSLVKCCTNSFTSEQDAQEIEEFFASNKFPGTERTVKQSLERIRLNAVWLARDGEALKEFLNPWK